MPSSSSFEHELAACAPAGDQVAGGIELGDSVIAGIADVDVAFAAGGAIDSEEGRRFEGAGARSRGACDATRGAGVDAGAADVGAKGEEKIAGGVELLDAVVGAVGDVDIAFGGSGGVIDGDAGVGGELTVAVAGGAEGGFEDVGLLRPSRGKQRREGQRCRGGMRGRGCAWGTANGRTIPWATTEEDTELRRDLVDVDGLAARCSLYFTFVPLLSRLLGGRGVDWRWRTHETAPDLKGVATKAAPAPKTGVALGMRAVRPAPHGVRQAKTPVGPSARKGRQRSMGRGSPSAKDEPTNIRHARMAAPARSLHMVTYTETSSSSESPSSATSECGSP